MKLKLTRRRILLAALAAVAAIVVWWHWPRGDSRFVGKWKIEYQNGSLDGTVWLYSNGSSYWTAKGNRTRASSPWWVSEGRFHWGEPETLATWHPLRFAAKWIFQTTGHHFRPGNDDFDVLEVEQERISLRSLTDGPATLTRISE